MDRGRLRLTLTLILTLALALTLTLALALARTRWLLTHNTSPMTGAALPHKHLVPAISLRQLIVEFRGVGPDD